MCVTGTLPWTRGAFLFPAQMVGSLVGSALNSCTPRPYHGDHMGDKYHFYRPGSIHRDVPNLATGFRCLDACRREATKNLHPARWYRTGVAAAVRLSPCGNPRLGYFQPKAPISLYA
jgi:hypothetical protein